LEQKFSNNGLDLQELREFCEREGEEMTYRKGDQLEREGDPARWFAFVESGCFKYVNDSSERLRERQRERQRVGDCKSGMGDRRSGIDREHITWFSFAGEFVVDYPTFLYDRPSQTTIVAMMPSRIFRVTGEQVHQFFSQSMETMTLRAIIAEHILGQFRSRYLDLHCATPRRRYELLLQRCPGIVEHLPLNAISSFLCITPQMLSRIRKDITFEGKIE